MRGLNKATIIGHLGNDVDLRYTGNSDAVATFSVATSERWKDKQTGQNCESVEWHRCVLFGGLAEVAGKYLKKGSKVYIEGKIKTEKYLKDGVEKSTTKIVVGSSGSMIMLDGKKQEVKVAQDNNEYNQEYQGY